MWVSSTECSHHYLYNMVVGRTTLFLIKMFVILHYLFRIATHRPNHDCSIAFKKEIGKMVSSVWVRFLMILLIYNLNLNIYFS